MHWLLALCSICAFCLTSSESSERTNERTNSEQQQQDEAFFALKAQTITRHTHTQVGNNNSSFTHKIQLSFCVCLSEAWASWLKSRKFKWKPNNNNNNEKNNLKLANTSLSKVKSCLFEFILCRQILFECQPANYLCVCAESNEMRQLWRSRRYNLMLMSDVACQRLVTLRAQLFATATAAAAAADTRLLALRLIRASVSSSEQRDKESKLNARATSKQLS